MKNIKFPRSMANEAVEYVRGIPVVRLSTDCFPLKNSRDYR
ncbi:MAG: hypothetical protein ACLTK0_02825 [Anaerovoracaceae bacterium]